MSDLIVNPVPPDLRTLLDNLKADIFYNLNCHQLGVIEAFDINKQTASVRIATLRVLGTEEIPYPLLTDCPVMFPAGGSAYMTFPVAVGDRCLVLFNDRDIDNWFTQGSTVAPNSSRAHSLSDGIVLVGIRNATNPAVAPVAGAVTLACGTSLIQIYDSGVVVITGLDGSARSVVTLSDKVNIHNDATSLKSALDNLCSVLLAWVNTGGSTPNPATITAINAAKAQFDSLLS